MKSKNFKIVSILALGTFLFQNPGWATVDSTGSPLTRRDDNSSSFTPAVAAQRQDRNRDLLDNRINVDGLVLGQSIPSNPNNIVNGARPEDFDHNAVSGSTAGTVTPPPSSLSSGVSNPRNTTTTSLSNPTNTLQLSAGRLGGSTPGTVTSTPIRLPDNSSASPKPVNTIPAVTSVTRSSTPVSAIPAATSTATTSAPVSDTSVATSLTSSSVLVKEIPVARIVTSIRNQDNQLLRIEERCNVCG